MGQAHPTTAGTREIRKSWTKDFLPGPPIEKKESEEEKGEEKEGSENEYKFIYPELPTIDETIRKAEKGVQEDYLRVAHMSLLKEAISACYRANGPNHHVICRPLYLQYIKLNQSITPGINFNLNQEIFQNPTPTPTPTPVEE